MGSVSVTMVASAFISITFFFLRKGIVEELKMKKICKELLTVLTYMNLGIVSKKPFSNIDSFNLSFKFLSV